MVERVQYKSYSIFWHLAMVTSSQLGLDPQLCFEVFSRFAEGRWELADLARNVRPPKRSAASRARATGSLSTGSGAERLREST